MLHLILEASCYFSLSRYHVLHYCVLDVGQRSTPWHARRRMMRWAGPTSPSPHSHLRPMHTSISCTPLPPTPSPHLHPASFTPPSYAHLHGVFAFLFTYPASQVVIHSSIVSCGVLCLPLLIFCVRVGPFRCVVPSSLVLSPKVGGVLPRVASHIVSCQECKERRQYPGRMEIV